MIKCMVSRLGQSLLSDFSVRKIVRELEAEEWTEENRWLPEAAGGAVGEMDEEGEKAATSRHKMNTSWGCHVQHGD